jgi:hypothetical protein
VSLLSEFMDLFFCNNGMEWICGLFDGTPVFSLYAHGDCAFYPVARLGVVEGRFGGTARTVAIIRCDGFGNGFYDANGCIAREAN